MTPRFDAQFIVIVAVVCLIHAAILRHLAGDHHPAVFCKIRPALFDVYGGYCGAACPVEGIHVAELVGVVFEVHVGGEVGLRIGVVVFGGAAAGDLAEGVEVLGPPDWVPDCEILEPVSLADGAGVGGVPGLQGVGVVFDVRGIGENMRVLSPSVAEDPSGDTVEDDDGAGGWGNGFPVGDDGKGWDGGYWIHDGFGKGGRLGGCRICSGRSHCRILRERRYDLESREAKGQEEIAPSFLHVLTMS